MDFGGGIRRGHIKERTLIVSAAFGGVFVLSFNGIVFFFANSSVKLSTSTGTSGTASHKDFLLQKKNE